VPRGGHGKDAVEMGDLFCLVAGQSELTVMAGHDGALVEEEGDGIGAHRRVRCPVLDGMSCTTPRGCRGTCSLGRGRPSAGAAKS
jgi:hypothetical protein